MNQLNQIISSLLSISQPNSYNKQQYTQINQTELYNKLLDIITKNNIIQQEMINLDNSILLSFFLKKSFKANGQFYKLLSNVINYIYTQNKNNIKFVYQLIPMILSKYIQIYSQSQSPTNDDQKVQHLQNCIRIIYNQQFSHLNQKIISKQLSINKSSQIGSLYKQHFHRLLKNTPKHAHLNELQQQDEINSSTRIQIKCVLLMTIFNNLSSFCEKSIISYLWMVYIFCGGNQQQDQTGMSLYLLQKKNLFSIFKYYISEEEISIILLTLYELSIQRKKNKFQIYSSINMIHKKTANESLFKLSQVTQSMIHLLEDQYSDAFS